MNDENVMLIFYRDERLAEPEGHDAARRRQDELHHAVAGAALSPDQAEET